METAPRIYLDNNATTLVDPRVREVIIHSLQQYMGNPSSIHYFGQESSHQLAEARRTIAAFLSVRPSEIIFTSGGTEGLNLLIRGIAGRHPGGHIVSSDLEHSGVYETVKNLVQKGHEATFISPGAFGAATVEQVEAALRPDTRLIVLMAANNETGVKTDIAAIAELADQRGIPFVVDYVGLFGKELFVLHPGITGAVFSGHKFHAPKGAGMVFLRRGTKIEPLYTGGGHEFGLRPGTENLASILGLAEAVRCLQKELPTGTDTMAALRDRLEQGLMQALDNVSVNGQGPRVANTTNLAFAGVEGEALLMSLDLAGIAVSHGSACSSGALQPSRVLLNMGIAPELARASIRFSVSRFTTEEEIDRTIEAVRDIVSRLRSVVR